MNMSEFICSIQDLKTKHFYFNDLGIHLGEMLSLVETKKMSILPYIYSTYK